MPQATYLMLINKTIMGRVKRIISLTVLQDHIFKSMDQILASCVGIFSSRSQIEVISFIIIEGIKSVFQLNDLVLLVQQQTNMELSKSSENHKLFVTADEGT